MKRLNRRAAATAALVLAAAGTALAHGDVTPQVVNTAGLPTIGSVSVDSNPYRQDSKLHAAAASIGASAYNQNCARCHGIEAVSGGIAPDLRHLPAGEEGDEYFHGRVANGVIRNGITYMPAFKEVFSEEAIWAIRSYLDQVHVDE